MSSLNNSYPVTQYLIERYYELCKKPIPIGPNLTIHKSSDELFNLISGDNDSATDLCKDSNDELLIEEDVDFEIKLPFYSFLRVNAIWNTVTSLRFNYSADLQIQKLLKEKKEAISYQQWVNIGSKLDELMGKEQWKSEIESNLYDYKLIQELTGKLHIYRITEDYNKLLYLIRTTWMRNLGNTCSMNLYRHSNVGTKKAIEEYLLESQLAIDSLVNNSELDPNYLLRILQHTRRNVGKTALVLSGGATFGLFHIGVLAALYEEDLVPRVISGTSAGSIVASIFCVHTKDEIPGLLASVLDMEFNIFKDNKDKSNSEDFLIKMDRFFKQGTWFINKHLLNTMVGFLGDMTFKEAYYRTGRILNITVSSASTFEQPRLLNHLTAPNVLIWSAVCASCSVPGIFPATPLYEKDPKTNDKKEWTGNSSVKFVDGSVENDLPISRLSEMFNIDHIIACQVNAHVFPFLKFSVNCVGGEVQNEFSARFKQVLNKCYDFVTEEVIHYLEMGSELGLAPNMLTKLRSVLSQQYSGNITILPELSMLFKSNELLKNPSQEFLLHETVFGARATWSKISMIRNNCGQEFALDKAIYFLKEKIIMSTSIKNPLQFSESTIRVSDLPTNKIGLHGNVKHNEHHEKATSLDDNIIEPYILDSLLVVSKTNIPHATDKRLRSLSLREPAHVKNHEDSISSLPFPNKDRGSSVSKIRYFEGPYKDRVEILGNPLRPKINGRVRSYLVGHDENTFIRRKGRSSTVTVYSSDTYENK